MKIVYINFVESKEGLGTLDVFTPLKELARRGNEITLISLNDGTKHYKLKYGSKGFLEVLPILPLKLHSLKAPLLQVVLMYLNSLTIFTRLVQTIAKQKPQIILSSSDYSLPFISFFASMIGKVPVVLIHRETHLESYYFFPNYSLPVKYVSAFLAKINLFFYRKFRRSLAISKSIEVFLSQSLNLNNITTINLLCTNIQDINKQSVGIRNEGGIMPIASNELVILYSGYFSRIRGIDTLFKAFNLISKDYPNSILRISGNVNLTEWKYLKQNLGRAALSKVSLTGFLSRREMINVMLHSVLCVDPSPVNSWNPSGKIAEYMASAKCVVTTDTFTHRFFIKNGVNGLLFEAGNVEDLVKKLELALANPEYREMLGNRARLTIEESFEVRKVATLFEEFLKAAIKEYATLNYPKASGSVEDVR